jgi:cytoskeletal protein RodZ
VFEIGNSLREARLRREIEFAEAEYGTKIRGKYLRALEDERFELLPSHTYVKGFLRSYAEYLGLDGQLYVDEYNSRYVTIGEEDAPMRTAARRVPAARARKSERRESNIVLLALTAIGIVTALVIVAWRFGGVENEPVRGLTTPQRQVAPAPQAAGTARLELRATRGDSYMIVRAGSSVGDANMLYEGTLERTQKKRFDSRVLWLRLESPQNVLVKLNGNRIKLPKAVKAQGVFVTAKKVFAADAR